MIGIFDSGIGGVTVLKEIIKLLPNYHYFYYSDSKNNPYGDKNLDQIYSIVYDVVVSLMEQGCTIIVIACNTASAICVNKLRDEFPNFPFVAIEPAYKMLYNAGVTTKTLVMATRGTIESERFQALYKQYDNGHTILYPCIGLASLIELGNMEEVSKYLKQHFQYYQNVKNVVLGCTHYPLIKDLIKDVLGDVTFYDGSYGVALELERKIKKHCIKNKTSLIDFYDSSNDVFKEKRFWNFLEKGKI